MSSSDIYRGYERIHGEPPIPNGNTCYYEDGTLCMFAEENIEGESWCTKFHCKLYPQYGYIKLSYCPEEKL